MFDEITAWRCNLPFRLDTLPSRLHETISIAAINTARPTLVLSAKQLLGVQLKPVFI